MTNAANEPHDPDQNAVNGDDTSHMNEADPQAPNSATEEAQSNLDDVDSSQDPASVENMQAPGGDAASERIQALETELAQRKDQLLRALAEADNTRRRAIKDREDAGKFAISGFAKDLLDVADNLRRALDAFPEDLASDERLKNLVDGIEATERSLLKTFEKNGISKLSPTEGAFDPNVHEVMFEAPGTGQPAGSIIQLIEAGYTLNGRLLRPARVGVAKDEGQGSAPSANKGSGHQVDTEA